MSRLPDRLDLWLRKARESADPARQVDWVMGALVALNELHFLNIGSRATPLIAKAAIAPDECALVFSDLGRVEDFLTEFPAMAGQGGEGPPVITSPTVAALKWCLENRAGLIINPSVGETALVPFEALAPFVEEWQKRGGRQSAGFWIPNMTTEEEDFWRENGL